MLKGGVTDDCSELCCGGVNVGGAAAVDGQLVCEAVRVKAYKAVVGPGVLDPRYRCEC